METAKIFKEIAELHPYRQRGNPDSYNDYSQGWADACDVLESRILSQQPKEEPDQEGEWKLLLMALKQLKEVTVPETELATIYNNFARVISVLQPKLSTPPESEKISEPLSREEHPFDNNSNLGNIKREELIAKYLQTFGENWTGNWSQGFADCFNWLRSPTPLAESRNKPIEAEEIKVVSKQKFKEFCEETGTDGVGAAFVWDQAFKAGLDNPKD